MTDLTGSEKYEMLLNFQARIALGLSKPEGLTEYESNVYDALSGDIDDAVSLGYIPAAGDSGAPEPKPRSCVTETPPSSASAPPPRGPTPSTSTPSAPPHEDIGEKILLEALGLTQEEVAALPVHPRPEHPNYIEPGRQPHTSLRLSELEADSPPSDEPRKPIPVYPDTDVMTRMLKDITLGASKPGDLSPIESAAWDRLAAEVAEARAEGYIIEIPAE